MSKRKSPRRISSASFSMAKLSSYARTAVVVVCLGAMIIAVGMQVGPPKFLTIILAPIIAELAVLDLGRYIAAWVRKASPFRGLITSVFGFVVGGMFFTTSGLELAGIAVIILSGALFAYMLLTIYRTRRVGVKSQDPVLTGSLVAFLTSIVALVLGSYLLFAVLIFCSVLLLLYKSLASDIIITVIAAGLIQTLLYETLYAVVVLSVGVAAIATGVYLGRRQQGSRIVRGFTALEGLISSAFAVAIGVALMIVNVNALLLGSIAIIVGAVLAVYVLWRFRLTKDWGVKGHDPVATADLVIFLASLLALVLGALAVFGFLLSSSIVILLYKKPYFVIIVVVFAAIFLSGIFVDAIYPMGVISVGIFSVALGMVVKKIESDRTMKAISGKRK